MCMMAPPPMNYTPPKRPPKEAGPESPDDMVNDEVVNNVNDRSEQQANRDAVSGKSHSNTKGDKAY